MTAKTPSIESADTDRLVHAHTHTHTFTYTHTDASCNGSLLLKRGGDEEGVRLGVFVLSHLDADLRDAHTHLIQEPQQSVVVDHVCGDRSLFISADKR